MVRPLGIEASMQGIPARCFIGIDGATGRHPGLDGGNRFILGLEHERQDVPVAFKHDDTRAALARLVDGKATVKGLLKAELKHRNVTYRDLASRLEAMSIHETERNLNNKISRGGFRSQTHKPKDACYIKRLYENHRSAISPETEVISGA